MSPGASVPYLNVLAMLQLSQTRLCGPLIERSVTESGESEHFLQVWPNSDLSVSHPRFTVASNITFPEGMYYSKKTDTTQTPRVNELIRASSELSKVLGQKDGRNHQF